MESIVLLLSNSQGAQLNSYIYIFLRYWYPSYHTLKKERFFFLRQLIYRLNCFLVKSSFLLRGYFANDLYFFVSSSTSSYNLSTFIERRNKFSFNKHHNDRQNEGELEWEKKKKEKRLQFSRICAKRSRIEVKYINK